MLLADLAQTSRAVAATSARSAKTELIAAALRRAGPGEVGIAVRYLAGELRQRRTGVGWAALRDAPPPAAEPTLTLSEVDDGFERIATTPAGAGSAARRRDTLAALFARATTDEQALLRGLVSGELRQGALEGVMVEAVARATEVPVADVRRALMLRGSLPAVAAAAVESGREGLAAFRLQVGRPLQPMLAQTANDVDEAVARTGPAVVDWKLDGVRVQVHRAGDDIAVFSRTLDDITARVPEVVAAAAALPVSSVVLDGEAIALHPDGRPRPFQETGARVAARTPKDPVPLTTYAFDLLHLDGADLLDAPLADRAATMTDVLPAELVVPRAITDDPAGAAAASADALAHGHEGVVVKALTSPYEAGRRGAAWVKVKPRHTLDLVVLAAEWGHGRRRGWLSNLHLGARDPEHGGFVMLGKTFKGLTDELLRWQTEQLLALEVARNEWQVFVRPELVVEIAFDGVQTSPRYPGGMALRFARVLRYRPDKRADEADAVDDVRRLHRL